MMRVVSLFGQLLKTIGLLDVLIYLTKLRLENRKKGQFFPFYIKYKKKNSTLLLKSNLEHF